MFTTEKQGQQAGTISFCALNTATGEQTVFNGLHAIGQAKKKALALWGQGVKCKVYPIDCPVYLSVQIAKTVITVTLARQETITNRTIYNDVCRLTAEYNKKPSADCESFFMEKLYTCSHDTQDYIMFALQGTLSPACNVQEQTNNGFISLNAYLQRERTRHNHETITLYDIIEQEEKQEEGQEGQPDYIPAKITNRQIVSGLTDREKEQGISAPSSPLALAIHETTTQFAPVKKQVFLQLAQGKTVYRISKDMQRDKKTVKEHVQSIGKALAKNPVIIEHVQGLHRKGIKLSNLSRKTGETGEINDYFTTTAQGIEQIKTDCFLSVVIDDVLQAVQGFSCGAVPSRIYTGYTPANKKPLFTVYYSPSDYRQSVQDMYNRLFDAIPAPLPVLPAKDMYRKPTKQIIKYFRMLVKEGGIDKKTALHRIINCLAENTAEQGKPHRANRRTAPAPVQYMTAPAPVQIVLPRYIDYHAERYAMYRALLEQENITDKTIK